MIDFGYTAEQRIIRETIREFGAREIVPNVRRIDNEKRIPKDLLSRLVELGIMGMAFSPEYGGADADPVTCGVVVEELARADITCAIPTLFLVQNAWGYILGKYGTERVKKDILPLVTQGRAFLGIAATEPNVGSDVAQIQTFARKIGDRYLLSGEKMYISGIDEVVNQLPDGGGYVTLVRTGKDRSARSLSLIYVPIKVSAKMRVTMLDDWGRRGISSGGFNFAEYEIPGEYLIGEENRGFHIAMEGFDFARALISLVCCGAAQSCLEQTTDYLKTRKAFGQPIGKFEGVQFRLAEHWSRLEAAKWLGYKALWMYGHEQKEKKFSRGQVALNCAAAKLNAVPLAFEAINDALQWFGAYGYTTDCPLELSLKAVRSYYWAEGSLEIMKIIVGRELLGKEYVCYR